MWTEILSKLGAESLLSLYPSFVKNIGLPIGIQMWSRYLIYVVLSLFFVDWGFIHSKILSKESIALIVVTLIHVFSSYEGFLNLESGVSYAIFYTYPLLILLLSGNQIHPVLFLSIIGVYLLSYSDDTVKKEKVEGLDVSREVDSDPKKNKQYGVIMILIAALTEAFIYFIVRELKTPNSWNHVFLSYFVGAIGMTAYYARNITTIMSGVSGRFLFSLFGNGAIGLIGYLLRFYSMPRLPPTLYAPLSYFGIFMAFVYGVIFNNDRITLTKIIGTILVVVSNVFYSIKK